MKTKKKTNLLLLLVVGVWGAIGVRAILLLNPSTPEIEQQDYLTKTDFKLNTKIDTFSIQTVNRDPFLGTVLKKNVSNSTKNNVYKRRAVQWKPITYQGVVQKDNTNQKIFIVSINGKQHLLKQGQTIDSVTLAYGSSESVTLRYKNSSKSFSLKK